MNYSVELAPNFKKEAKRLAKKYPSLKDDLKELFKELKKNPTLGTPLGNDVYKIRLAIASKNKGKFGRGKGVIAGIGYPNYCTAVLYL